MVLLSCVLANIIRVETSVHSRHKRIVVLAIVKTTVYNFMS